MKVLITGGYGFIGSHVAERFYKEGYEIFIIDNLATGRKDNIKFKHKGYIMSVGDEKCEEIFRAHQFDVVVHLAAQVSVKRSLTDPQLDTESNVLGFVNMLDFSTKHNVKRFIYASSAAVYGNDEEPPYTEKSITNPISPYGLSKLSNEVYSAKWNELYNLSTIGFRFSNVYGPRQRDEGEGGVISIFVSKLLRNEPITIHGDGSQTRDFIYVEDVVDAIYRSANSDATGVYNLSTHTATSINELVEELSHLYANVEIKYAEKREGDIPHSILDNTLVMRTLDWSPLYTLKEGLERTAAYFLGRQQTSEITTDTAIAAPPQATFKTYMKKLFPTFENLLAFALTAWLTLSIIQNSHSVIDVKLFYITIIGILYGNRQGILAVILSVGLFTYQKLADGRDFISLTYDTDFFFQVAIYIFIGLVVGYSIERKNTRITQQEQKISEFAERYELLNHVYNEVREVKDELQLRILNSSDSYGKIYHATKELESLEPELVFSAAVNVVKSIMHVDKVKIYTVNSTQKYLRLMASTGYSSEHLKKSLRADDAAYIQQVLQSGKIYVNKELEAEVPLMTAPLVHDERITAIVSIDDISFESFTRYHENLFQITVNLISSALSKAFLFIEATETNRYVSGTSILRQEVFQKILDSKINIKHQHQVPYLLIESVITDMTIQEAANYIAPQLRETDYLGLDEQQQLKILLSNSSDQDVESVLQRISHPSIVYTTVGGV